MQLLVLMKVRFQICKALYRRGIHADLLRRFYIINISLRHAQLFIRRHSIIHAAHLRAGKECRIQTAEDGLPIVFQQVSVFALVHIERREESLPHRSRIALPISCKEQIDPLPGLQRGQRLRVPIPPADEHEFQFRADLWLQIGVDCVLYRRAGAGILISNLIVFERIRLPRPFGRGIFLFRTGTGRRRQAKQQRKRRKFPKHTFSLLMLFPVLVCSLLRRLCVKRTPPFSRRGSFLQALRLQVLPY